MKIYNRNITIYCFSKLSFKQSFKFEELKSQMAEIKKLMEVVNSLKELVDSNDDKMIELIKQLSSKLDIFTTKIEQYREEIKQQQPVKKAPRKKKTETDSKTEDDKTIGDKTVEEPNIKKKIKKSVKSKENKDDEKESDETEQVKDQKASKKENIMQFFKRKYKESPDSFDEYLTAAVKKKLAEKNTKLTGDTITGEHLNVYYKYMKENHQAELEKMKAVEKDNEAE